VFITFCLVILQNLSQQSDISDLLGGFKPTDARSICYPLYVEFKDLFCRSFSVKVRRSLGSHGVGPYLKFFDLCYN
jgi:midasin (ATPase involved in ribosome maturation)